MIILQAGQLLLDSKEDALGAKGCKSDERTEALSGLFVHEGGRMKELNHQELRRQDFVDNAIHALLCKLAGRPLPWDISHIGEVRDVCQRMVCQETGTTEKDFYPEVEPDSKGLGCWSLNTHE